MWRGHSHRPLHPLIQSTHPLVQGRFIVVCGDGEYIIYTSQALRNKAFGAALDFVWSAVGTGDYAVRESISRCVLRFVWDCILVDWLNERRT